MKIIFAGGKERGKLCLEALLKEKENIIRVIVEPNKGDLLKAVAEKYKIPILEPKNINEPAFVEKIKDLTPDLMILVSYVPILHKPILDVPKKGIINCHGGKIPEYRGASPINWQIINGDTEGGATILYATEGIDEGDVLAQKRFPIKITDTVKEVTEKTLDYFPSMLVKVVKQIKNGTVKSIKQDLTKGKYYGSRKPEDGLIDFKYMTAKQVYDYVRALTHPLPGAFTYCNNKKLYIWKASLLSKDFIHNPGKVFLKKDNGVIVMAKDKGLLLEIVQEEGKNETSAKEYFAKIGCYLENKQK